MSEAPTLDTSAQRAHEWLREIGYGLGFDNQRSAQAALRAMLHALRDRLPVELVAHFGAGLPTVIRGLYYEGWHPSAANLKAAHAQDFNESMRQKLRGHDELLNTEHVAQTVMRVIDHRMDRGQIDHMLGTLPERVGAMWRTARQQDLVH